MTDAGTPEARPLAAATWMLGSVVAFTVMAVAARNVSQVHDSFEILMIRSAVGFGVVLAWGFGTGQISEVSTDRLRGHFLRNIVHFAGQNLWFTALTLIPLAQVFALEFTSPLWVILLAPVFLGEQLTLGRLLAAGLGFGGILIATRPDLAHPSVGVLAGLGAAMCFATVSILTKRLTRGVSVLAILFWLTLMQFFLGLICAGRDGQITWPDSQTLPWLVLIGLCGVMAHLSLITALSLAPATFVAPIDFLRLPLIAVVAALLFAEPVDPWVLVGGAVIFAGIWLNIRSQIRPARANPL
ncbi:MAG: DMT family transporter [Alphaproteobacteria bacterium]